MNRKINLAKIAKKGVEQAVKYGLTTENQAKEPVAIKSESPYFSPISNRTRNKQLQKLSKSPNKTDENPSTSTIEKFEKKVATRKHIKVEYDETFPSQIKAENDQPIEKTSNALDAKTTIMKSENKPIKRTSQNEKPIKLEADTDAAEKQMKWEPKNWQQIYDKIKKMRAGELGFQFHLLFFYSI